MKTILAGILLLLLAGCRPGGDPLVVVPPSAEQGGGQPPLTTPPAVTTTTPDVTQTPPIIISPSTMPQGIDVNVRFAAGTTGTSLSGQIVPGAIDRYRLAAQAGQEMSVVVSSNTPEVGLMVALNNGQIRLTEATNGIFLSDWRGILPQDGEYVVEIFSLQARADYMLDINISALPQPGDLATEGFRLMESLEVGGYTAEIWSRGVDEADLIISESVGRLKQGQTVLAQLPNTKSLGALTGTDINGNGTVDILFEGYSGGAHCCFSLDIFDLGATAAHILALSSGNCGAQPVDLDGDGLYEIATCDDSFAYRYCAYAGSPAVAAYLYYEDGAYRPAAPNDPALYSEQVTALTDRLAAGSDTQPFGWDNTNKCEVLGLALIYLYTGRQNDAYQVLVDYYNGPDLPFFWADIQRVVSRSLLYVPAGAAAEVDYPDYYQITPVQICGEPGDKLFLYPAGEERCSNTSLRQPLSWLSSELVEIFLLDFGEYLELGAESCNINCVVDIVAFDGDSGQNQKVGQLWIMEGDGPTTVQRLDLNGQPVSQIFALRGDLSWESR